MSQDLFRVELGLADDNIHYLSGAGAPAGTLADAAPVGSSWTNSTNGDVYTKRAAGWDMLTTAGTAIDAYTRAETDARIQGVVGAAPAALDTLKEIADALNNDASAVANLTTLIGTKASTTDLSTEAANRASADTTLQGNINAEATARADADTALQGNINAVSAALANAQTQISANGVVTVASMHNVPCNSSGAVAVKWSVYVREPTTGKVQALEVFATHNGDVAGAGSASAVDYTVYAKLKMGGSIAGLVCRVDLAGNAMHLMVGSSAGVTVRAVAELIKF